MLILQDDTHRKYDIPHTEFPDATATRTWNWRGTSGFGFWASPRLMRPPTSSKLCTSRAPLVPGSAVKNDCSLQPIRNADKELTEHAMLKMQCSY